MQVKVWCI